MMSKERLEETRKNVTGILSMDDGEIDSVDLPLLDFIWLYEYAKEQSERANKNAQDLEDMDRQLASTQEHMEKWRNRAIDSADQVMDLIQKYNNYIKSLDCESE